MTTTAKINSKGTKGTGITETLASVLHDNLGKTVTAVIELRSESRGENLKGDETVNLAIQTIEVIPEEVGAAEHVREISKAAYRNRKFAEDGPTLPTDDSGSEPNVADVLAAGAKHVPHEYLEATDEPICDVCGNESDAPVHVITDDLTPDDPQDDEQPDDDQLPLDEGAPDEDDEPLPSNVAVFSNR